MIAPLKDSASSKAAAAFAEFILSDEAQQLLEEMGFGPA